MLGEIEMNSVMHSAGMNTNSCGLSEVVWTNPHSFLTGSSGSGRFNIELQSFDIADVVTDSLALTIRLVEFPSVSIALTQDIEVTQCETASITSVVGGELESTSLIVNSHSEWKALDLEMFVIDPLCMNPLSFVYYVDDVEVTDPNSDSAFPALLEFIPSNTTFVVNSKI